MDVLSSGFSQTTTSEKSSLFFTSESLEVVSCIRPATVPASNGRSNTSNVADSALKKIAERNVIVIMSLTTPGKVAGFHSKSFQAEHHIWAEMIHKV